MAIDKQKSEMQRAKPLSSRCKIRQQVAAAMESEGRQTLPAHRLELPGKSGRLGNG